MVDQADTGTDTSGSHTLMSKLCDIMLQFDLHKFPKGHHDINIKPFIPNALMYGSELIWLENL